MASFSCNKQKYLIYAERRKSNFENFRFSAMFYINYEIDRGRIMISNCQNVTALLK